MMGGLVIGKGRYKAPIAQRPEMAVSIVIMDGQICRHMGQGGERENEQQLAPDFLAQYIARCGEGGIDGDRIEIGDEVLHGRLKVKLVP